MGTSPRSTLRAGFRLAHEDDLVEAALLGVVVGRGVVDLDELDVEVSVGGHLAGLPVEHVDPPGLPSGACPAVLMRGFSEPDEGGETGGQGRAHPELEYLDGGLGGEPLVLPQEDQVSRADHARDAGRPTLYADRARAVRHEQEARSGTGPDPGEGDMPCP